MPRKEFKTKFPEVIVAVDGIDYPVAGVTMDMYQEMRGLTSNPEDPELLKRQIKLLLPSMEEEKIGKLEIGMVLEIVQWIMYQITGAYTQLTAEEKNESRPADVQSEK